MHDVSVYVTYLKAQIPVFVSETFLTGPLRFCYVLHCGQRDTTHVLLPPNALPVPASPVPVFQYIVGETLYTT